MLLCFQNMASCLICFTTKSTQVKKPFYILDTFYVSNVGESISWFLD